ncbi:39S ribosomal protein L15, mitochondrial [Schistosoma japonicum]|uniref:Large ribosomal subunit protein uL15m n=1 Tax=Schistosoma japonicum TaxID=6182 RepID=C1L5Z3_SCHJA|nr:39S ribosomal protein L15, mitochondrial [Schistosoma japonicum]CAX70121.1 39S ribosomal protein L15, mitochondrial precursor [Schistosoma japonicum]
MPTVDKALGLLRKYPRVCPQNVTDLPGSRPSKYQGLQRKRKGLGHRGFSQHQTFPPLGVLTAKTPFYLSVPREPYNIDSISATNLLRVSLLELQRLIDLKRINPLEPIDISTLCNTNLYRLNVDHDRHYGFHLTEEGIDNFVTPVNIEVQHASEEVIAAVERVGGIICNRFYDLYSVWVKSDPQRFFMKGIPIPKAKLPPNTLIPFYANAESRGYLADPEAVAKSRIWLAQKYGYRPTDFSSSSESIQKLMSMRKDPRQIFYGLEPGWLVSIPDKVVLKPKSDLLETYYKS